MKRLNILFVLDVFAFDTVGGVGTVFYEYAKGLVEKGHNVFVLFRRRNKKLPLRGTIDGIHFFTYDNNNRNELLFMIWCVISTFKSFKEIMKETSLDLIHIHHPLPAIGISLKKESRKIAKVYSFYSPWDWEYKLDKSIHSHHLVGRFWIMVKSFFRRLIEKKSLKKCEKVVALSKYSECQLQKIHHISSSKIVIIPGGVDINKFHPAADQSSVRNRLSIPRDKFVLLTVRRLVPRMGIQNLIRAISSIEKERKDIYLIIGGKGSLEDSLKELTNNLGLERYVHFVGFIEPEQLPLYYQAADLFILPTLELEGFGLVTLEALSSGLPVLGTPIGGTKEILGRLDTDLMFKDTNSDSMAELILDYIQDRKILLDLRLKCRKFVEDNYTWDRSVRLIEEVFSQLTK